MVDLVTPEHTRLIAAFGLQIALTISAGVLITPHSPTRRRLGLVLALLLLLPPLLLPREQAGLRFISMLFGVLGLGRSLDLARPSTALGPWARIWMLVALFDVRALARTRSRLDPRELGWWLGHALLLILGWIVVFELAPRGHGAARWALRWGAGTVVCYAFAEILQSTLMIAYRALGLSFPRVNERPILSRTLGEFWGQRWNRVVATWLHDYLFRPLARRRLPRAGVLAAFAGSTGLHFWVAWIPLGVVGGLWMGSFFVVHGVAVLAERAIGVARWPAAAQRGWTLAWFAISAPLFVEPMMQIFAAVAELFSIPT